MIAQIVQKLIAPMAGQGVAGQGGAGQGVAGQSAAKGDEPLPPSDGEGQFAGLMADGGDAPLDDPIETAPPTDPALMGAEVAQAAPTVLLPAAGAMALVWAGTMDASLSAGDALLGGDLVAGENLALGQRSLAQGAGFAAAPFALGPAVPGDDSAQAVTVGQVLAQAEGAVEKTLAAVKTVGAGVAAPIGAAQVTGFAVPDKGADAQGAFQLPAELDQRLAVAGPSDGARAVGQVVTAVPLPRQSAHVDMAHMAAPRGAHTAEMGLGDPTQIKVVSAELPVIALPAVDPNTGKAVASAALAAIPGVAGIKGLVALGDGPRKDRIDKYEVVSMDPASPAPLVTQIAAPFVGGQMGFVMMQPAAQWWAADHAAPLGLGDGLGSGVAIGEVGLRAQGAATAAGPVFAMPNPSTPIAAQLIPYAGAAQSGPVEVTLSPAELGQLKFEILHRGEGVQIVLSAERGDTLDLLRRNSDQLLADFRNAGFSGASLSFGGWGAGQGQSAPVADEATVQDAPDSAQALAQSTAAFARTKPMLDPSRSLNLRL